MSSRAFVCPRRPSPSHAAIKTLHFFPGGRAGGGFSCAEACCRLCTFGKVYKEKAGMRFDSLAKAFVEEFRLPPNGFPKTEAAALSGKDRVQLPSFYFYLFLVKIYMVTCSCFFYTRY